VSLGALRVQVLRPRDREAALALLRARPRANLLLIDAVRRLGSRPEPGGVRSRVLAVARNGALLALASLEPVLDVDAAAPEVAVGAFVPHLGRLGAGLLKTRCELAGRLWEELRARGRRALLDRCERAFALAATGLRCVEAPAGTRLRRAGARDLPELVDAARASLREEQRPDPFEGDAAGFRRWVAGRLERALVIEAEGCPRFVAYADVRCPEGWLLQGVYTWPGWRRRGLAAAGVAALCARAFESGAGHVQLAVVEGNRAAEALYRRVGFAPFSRLRTIAFA